MVDAVDTELAMLFLASLYFFRTLNAALYAFSRRSRRYLRSSFRNGLNVFGLFFRGLLAKALEETEE